MMNRKSFSRFSLCPLCPLWLEIRFPTCIRSPRLPLAFAPAHDTMRLTERVFQLGTNRDRASCPQETSDEKKSPPAPFLPHPGASLHHGQRGREARTPKADDEKRC